MESAYPAAAGGDTLIYVPLPEKAVEVSRPVIARREGDGYRMPASVPDGEVWSVPPGSLVYCEEDPRGASSSLDTASRAKEALRVA